jgi:hypothetical protein
MAGMAEGILGSQFVVTDALQSAVTRTVSVAGALLRSAGTGGNTVHDNRRISHSQSTVNVNGASFGSVLLASTQQV